MLTTDAPEPLPADQAARLADFARACRTAARIVALYPVTHPAIRSALERVAEAGQRLRGAGNAVITVAPDALLLNGRGAQKPDSSIPDLAALLHNHLIGEMTILDDLTTTAWHTFLTLIARPPEEIRAEGGIGRAWLTAGGGPIELRQIDYAEVLRERKGGVAADWDRLIASYLEGQVSNLDDESMSALFDIAEDPSRFKEFTERLVNQASEGGIRGKKEQVLRVLQALADYVAANRPDQLDRILNEIAGVLPRLTADLVVTLITTGVPRAEGGQGGGIDLPNEVQSRLSDDTVAEFVAQSVSRDNGATQRLAQAFQALVPTERRGGLLEKAQHELENMPIGQQPEFPDLWKNAEHLLTTYSDSSFVSDEYARELSTARSHAIEVDRVSDDPPERIGAWVATVSDAEVQRLDQQLLLDLLQIEKRADAWKSVLDTAIKHVDQLILAGNLTLAQQMLDSVIAHGAEGQDFSAVAREGLDRLRSGPLMKHIVSFIRQARESDLKLVSNFCRTLGPTVIGPLADALAVEQTKGTVKRLREILLSFGAAGRAYARGLKSSANPAVRRTAVELLRAFGGADALPDLVALLDDAESAVQREALRAIMQIGTNEAYGTLEQALRSGTARTRDAIMQVLGSSRDERAAPLFVHILDHTDPRGSLEGVYLAAVEALGKVGGDTESVAALKKVLYRVEWWAPFRAARLREAAATALRTCASDAAVETLEEAAQDGPRSVRRAARAALAAPAPRTSARRPT